MAKIMFNKANIEFEYDQATTTVTDNTDSNTVNTLIENAEIFINKTACREYYKPVDYITYSISVINAGGADTENVVISEPLLAQTFVAGSISLSINGVLSTDFSVGTIVTLQYAELYVEKIAASTATCGDNFDYIIEITNNGNENASKVTITDAIPMEFRIENSGAVTINGISAEYTFDIVTRTITIPIETILPGDSNKQTIIISGLINCKPIVN